MNGNVVISYLINLKTLSLRNEALKGGLSLEKLHVSPLTQCSLLSTIFVILMSGLHRICFTIRKATADVRYFLRSDITSPVLKSQHLICILLASLGVSRMRSRHYISPPITWMGRNGANENSKQKINK